MTNKNHSAFLMCPTSRTTQLGGTPLESGEAGGHIRKTWVHAADAALLGLPAAVRHDQLMTHCLEPHAHKKGEAHADCRKRVAVGVHGEHCGGDGTQMNGAKNEALYHLSPLPVSGAALLFAPPEGMKQRFRLLSANLAGLPASEFADGGQLDASGGAQLAHLRTGHGFEGLAEGFELELSIHLRIFHPFMDSRQVEN
jgi:hypothetical protein